MCLIHYHFPSSMENWGSSKAQTNRKHVDTVFLFIYYLFLLLELLLQTKQQLMIKLNLSCMVFYKRIVRQIAYSWTHSELFHNHCEKELDPKFVNLLYMLKHVFYDHKNIIFESSSLHSYELECCIKILQEF